MTSPRSPRRDKEIHPPDFLTGQGAPGHALVPKLTEETPEDAGNIGPDH
ncbi:MAG: hypothetical protein ABSF59_16055 [Candidatus Sulfotelmatobacter sp.]|jgi:hypothetical protein